MTVVSHPESTASLIAILDQQRGLYEQLSRLSEEQSHLVKAGDPEPLLSLMSRRQQLIDQLAQASGKLEPYRKQWDEYWAGMDEPSRARVGDLVRQVQGLLEGIMEQDEQDRAALAARRAEVSGSVQRMRQGASLNRAYAQHAGPAAARFTDHQG